MKLTGILALILSVVTVLATPEDDLIAGTRTFAAKLYKELIKPKTNQNIIFSPITVQTIMSLIASASTNENGEVIQQIITSLNLPRGKVGRDNAFHTVLEDLNQQGNEFKVFDATKMYFGVGYSAAPWYQTIARTKYRSEIEAVNFGTPLITSQKINAWVQKKTNGKIANAVDSSDITANIRNMMINTLYLTGKWMKPFSAGKNIRKTFQSPTGAQTVTMMYEDKLSYGYFEDNDAQYLQLDMVRDGDAAMVFVLPRKDNGKSLSSLEPSIEHYLRDVKFVPTKVSVTLPKFSFGDASKLKPALQNIGVTKLFEWGDQLAGLRQLGHPPGHTLVVISDVSQKTVIDVNEWGVTAASVTIEKTLVDAPNVPPKIFTADHPFFFYIRVDDAVVFAGRVVKI